MQLLLLLPPAILGMFLQNFIVFFIPYGDIHLIQNAKSPQFRKQKSSFIPDTFSTLAILFFLSRRF
jgi:hypothetical protein